MDSFLGLTGTAWTAIGAIAGAASLAAAVAIAVIVQASVKRTDAAARRITRSIEELVRRMRRDDLLRQLRVERDPEHLRLLIDEARVLSVGAPAEQLGFEKAFFTNPAVPLFVYEHQMPLGFTAPAKRAVLDAAMDSLSDRYEDVPQMPPGLDGELAHLTRLSISLNAQTYKVAKFLLERSTQGWQISDGTIRTILHAEQGHQCSPNMEAASDYLYALQHRSVSDATLINVVGGVSLAIWDFYRLNSYGAPPLDAYTAYIMLMQRGLGTIGREADISRATLATDHAIAIMVDALGLVAANDQHLNMRALESLNPILGSFDSARFSSTGIVAEHFANGIRRLLVTNAPEHLRTKLATHADRLVPRWQDLGRTK